LIALLYYLQPMMTTVKIDSEQLKRAVAT